MKDNNPPQTPAFTGTLTFTPSASPTATPGLAVEPLVMKITGFSLAVDGHHTLKAEKPGFNQPLSRG